MTSTKMAAIFASILYFSENTAKYLNLAWLGLASFFAKSKR